MALGTDLLLIWQHRFFPALDYPAWLYEGRVIAQALKGHPLTGYTWQPFPVPNTLAVALLGLLDLLFESETAGKILVTMDAALFFGGSVYFLLWNASGRAAAIAISVAAFFTFGFFFFLGTLNYSLGLGLLFVYFGYVLRRSNLSATGTGPALFLSVLFLAHLLPYLVALIFSGSLLVFEYGLRSAIPRIVRTSSPSIMLLLWYSIARAVSGRVEVAAKLWNDWNVKSLETNFVCAFSGFYRFPPWDQAPGLFSRIGGLADILTCLAAAALLIEAARALLPGERSSDATTKAMLSASIICTSLYMLSPPQFQEVVSPGVRFLLPAAWLALKPTLRVVERRAVYIVSGFVVLIVFQTLYLCRAIPAAASGLEAVYERLDHLPEPRACSFYELSLSSTWPKARLPLFDRMPYIMPIISELPYYYYLRDLTIVAPDYSTSILKYRSGQPIMSTAAIFCRPEAYVPVKDVQDREHFRRRWH